MGTKIVAILGMALLSGCAVGVEYEAPAVEETEVQVEAPAEEPTIEHENSLALRLVVVPGTPSWAVEQAVKGAAMWCEATLNAYCPEVVFGEEISQPGDYLYTVDAVYEHTGGWAGVWPDHRLMLIDEAARDCASVIPHELGHTADLPHIENNPQRLMHPVSNCGLQEIDAETVADFQDKWNLEPVKAERLALDPASPAWAVEAVLEGAQMWCDATDSAYCPEVYMGTPERKGDVLVRVQDLGAMSAYGVYSPVSRAIALDPKAEGCGSVVAHEIGHTAGLGHVENEHELMYSSSQCEMSEIDAKTIRDYCETWGC